MCRTARSSSNLDDPAWSELRTERRRVGFSERVRDRRGARRGRSLRPARQRVDDLPRRSERREVRLPLIGDFNVINALGAAAAAYALGVPADRIAERLSSMPQVPGRLEVLRDAPAVLRDYAHTPDALERALDAVRPFTPERLIVVFGCGGDRDRGKRPEMGAIAESKADVAIVTSDNPRTEDPETDSRRHRSRDERDNHERIEDRRAAIARALEIATPRDVVVLAGKGHEDYQIRGTTKLPFDERIIVGELIAERDAASRGAPMSTAHPTVAKTDVLDRRIASPTRCRRSRRSICRAGRACLAASGPTRARSSRATCFVALVGERFDAHEFLADAVAKGAAGVVVSRRRGGASASACRSSRCATRSSRSARWRRFAVAR